MTLTTKTQHRITWALRLLLALAMGAGGAFKFVGPPQVVQIFTDIGIGQWFRYFTGLVEVGGAVLLLIPGAAFFGALLLAVTMVCGMATHLFLIGGNAIPALVMSLFSGYVAYRLRSTVMTMAKPGET